MYVLLDREFLIGALLFLMYGAIETILPKSQVKAKRQTENERKKRQEPRAPKAHMYIRVLQSPRAQKGTSAHHNSHTRILQLIIALHRFRVLQLTSRSQQF